MKELVREYTKEIKWRDEDYVPKTLKEHLKVSLISIGGTLVLCSAFVGMGDVVTKKIMEWVMSDAELVKSFGIFVRLSNDIVSTKVFLYPLTTLISYTHHTLTFTHQCLEPRFCSTILVNNNEDRHDPKRKFLLRFIVFGILKKLHC